jgi:hypothetical protein
MDKEIAIPETFAELQAIAHFTDMQCTAALEILGKMKKQISLLALGHEHTATTLWLFELRAKLSEIQKM